MLVTSISACGISILLHAGTWVPVTLQTPFSTYELLLMSVFLFKKIISPKFHPQVNCAVISPFVQAIILCVLKSKWSEKYWDPDGPNRLS